MRQRNLAACALAVAGCLALALVGPAAGGGKDNPGGKGGKPLLDAQFAQKAAMADLAEIQLGQLGAKQAASPDVRAFAQKMVADHTMSSKELMAIAGKKSLTLPTVLDEKHKTVAEKLTAMKGADFDRAFMEHMVMDHKQAVALYQGQVSQGQDPDLKAFATKTLPVIQTHLKMALEINAKVGGKGTGRGD